MKTLDNHLIDLDNYKITRSLMDIKEEFDNLVEKLKRERDEITLKAHLASMDARKELEGAEKKWSQLKEKASEIADDTVETSEEYIAKAKIVGEELKETYKRISKRLSE
jgi:hypothetical protein